MLNKLKNLEIRAGMKYRDILKRKQGRIQDPMTYLCDKNLMLNKLKDMEIRAGMKHRDILKRKQGRIQDPMTYL